MNNKKRMQFDFTEEAAAHLDALVETTGAASRAEVVRRALALFDYVLEATSAGAKVTIEKNGERERLALF